VKQHKEKIHPESHTARYNITQLVYFERFVSIAEAIRREKQLKGWLRIRKVQLIVGANPTWRDLSSEWGKMAKSYQWPEGEELTATAAANTGVLRCAQDDEKLRRQFTTKGK
jgi:putative endonuclease